MVNIKLWTAKETTVKIDAAGTSSFTAVKVLDTAASSATAITGQFKDVSIKVPIGDVEQVNLMGTTSSFQNAEMEEKPAGPFELSGTLVLPGDELMESEIFGSGTTTTTPAATHTTYQPGLASRTKVELLINYDDSTDEINWAMDNMYVTQWDVSHSADGHAEVAFTMKGLPRDFFGPQFKN